MRLFAVTGGFPTVSVSAKNSQLMQRMQRRIKSVSVDHAASQSLCNRGFRRRASVVSPNL
jgi:hypothetical protein